MVLRILLIDDNPHDRLLAIHALEREFSDLLLQQVIRPEELEQALSTGEFDVVITDYQLLWNDGITVLRAFKNRYPELPVIMFTNSGTQEIAVEAMKSGLDDYVIKSPSNYIRLPVAVRLAVERTETRRKVTGLEMRFQTLLNQLKVGVYRITDDNILLEANGAFLSLLGLNYLSKIPEDGTLAPYFQPEKYTELLKTLKADAEARDREEVLHRVDGSTIWVRISKTFNKINGNTLIDGIVEDITPRKLAQKALQESEARFRWLFASNVIGVAFWNLDGKVIEANDAYLQLIGYTREEMLVGTINWEEMTPPENKDINRQVVDELHQFGFSAPIENYYIHKTGRLVPILIACAFHEDSQSDGIAFVIDLTERKQAEKEREELLEREKTARAQAEAANRIKDEFLAILSHELRSPLNPILGWSKIITRQNLSPAKITEGLTIIERNANSLAQLIKDLLDVSQILRGKLSLNISPVNLETTISAALETVRLAAEAKAIQLYSIITSNIGTVLGDITRLQQVVWNLLANAVKFTPNGGRVEIRLQKVGTYAQIQVSDTGIGITPDFLPHVFDSFRQADSRTTRRFGGLGLGLAIVKHIVEMHGGTVTAQSQGEGQGSTFTVRLPLMQVRSQITQDAEQPQNPLELNGVKVLLVDDEADSREMAAFVLETSGAKVTNTKSAHEALQALTTAKPDILVLDIGMPEINGYMLLQQIRSLSPQQGGKIPAIALTAYAGQLDKNKAISAGFQAHLSKPVEPTELVEVVAQVLNRE
jgi:PAS domain S-box-containing protein